MSLVSSILLHMAFAAAALLVLPSVAGAETLYGFEGRCRSLTLADRDVSGRCENVTFSARFPDGRVGYIFLLDDGTHIAFTWPGASTDEELSGGVGAEKHVDQLGFLVRGEVERIAATGTCTMNIENAASQIACDTRSIKGLFAVQFEVDARTPPKKLFGAPEPPSAGR